MILSDLAIKRAIADGDITISPFNPDQLNPVSYDLLLGDEVLACDFDSFIDDVREGQLTRRLKIDPVLGIVLRPGVGYLMHTRERTATYKYVPIIDGKSSIGRRFVIVHATAGYGDPGFDGQWTLEVMSLCNPIRLYAGMRIAQIRFETIAGEVERTYNGNYQGSEGPVPSRSARQFQR